MPNNKIIEIFFLGMYIMYFLYTGAFLLKHPSNRHCKVVGYAMILWGTLAILSLYPYLNHGTTKLYNKVVYIIDMNDVASGWILLSTLCYRTKMTWRKAIPHYVPFTGLAIAQYFLPDIDLTIAASCYALIYSIIQIIPFSTHITRYRDYIFNHYSNHDKIHLSWLWQLFFWFSVVLAAWYSSAELRLSETMTPYYIVSMVAWFLMVDKITHQEELIRERMGREVAQKIVEEAKESRNFKHEGEYEFADNLMSICQNRIYFTRPNFTLTDLADILHTEPALLTYYFRHELDTTFYEFVNIQRTNMAATLLQTGSTDLDKIARQSGFSSTETFRRVYKDDFGHDPEKEIQKTKK